MRAVKVTLPDQTQVLVRTYESEDEAEGFTPGRVEVDMRYGRFGRTWTPIGMLGGGFEVEEPPRSRQETAQHYQSIAEELRREQEGAA